MITQRKALVLVTLLLLACALLNTRWTKYITRPITHTINFIHYPSDWIAGELKSDPVEDGPEYTDAELKRLLESAQKENAALWAENEKLNEQLKSFEVIYEYIDPKAVRLVEARVGRFNDDPNNPTMLVLRGSLAGLKRDDPVAFKSNLIGFVTDSIGPVNATVDLISRDGFSIGATIMYPPDPDNPDKEILPGWPFKTRVESDGKGRFFFDAKKKTAEGLRPGDIVRASDTILESANGFLIGYVEKVEDSQQDPLNLSRVYITPSVPIGPQRTVTILTERND